MGELVQSDVLEGELASAVYNSPSMRIVCRVLLVLGDHGTMDADQVHYYLPDLNVDQITSALTQLCIKQKIERVGKHGHMTRTKYKYNEEYTPPGRPKIVRCRSPISKAHESKGRLSVQAAHFRLHRERKLSTLQSLLPRVGPDERDVLIGIMNDYKSLE